MGIFSPGCCGNCCRCNLSNHHFHLYSQEEPFEKSPITLAFKPKKLCFLPQRMLVLTKNKHGIIHTMNLQMIREGLWICIIHVNKMNMKLGYLDA